jgi:hypothetical protein
MSVHALICTFDCFRSSFRKAEPVQPAELVNLSMVLLHYAFFTFFSMRLIFQLMSCAQSQKHSLHLHGAVLTSRTLVKKGMNYFAGYISTIFFFFARKSAKNERRVQCL